ANPSGVTTNRRTRVCGCWSTVNRSRCNSHRSDRVVRQSGTGSGQGADRRIDTALRPRRPLLRYRSSRQLNHAQRRERRAPPQRASEFTTVVRGVYAFPHVGSRRQGRAATGKSRIIGGRRMATSTTEPASTTAVDLDELGQQLRVDSVRCTEAAGAGHATSAMSAADLMALRLAKHLRYDFDAPEHPGNDHLVLSKGHAAPVLYAMYRAAGAISDAELLSYRSHGSRMEGHPTPRAPWVDVA